MFAFQAVHCRHHSRRPDRGFSDGILLDLLQKHGEDKEKLNASYQKLHEQGLWKLFRESFFALMTPVIILGTIYSGICSPTEAAVISVFYGLFICLFVYRTLKLQDLGKVFMEGAKTYVNILFVIAAAAALPRSSPCSGIPRPSVRRCWQCPPTSMWCC